MAATTLTITGSEAGATRSEITIPAPATTAHGTIIVTAEGPTPVGVSVVTHGGFQGRSDGEQHRQGRVGGGGLERLSGDMQGTNDGWRTKKSSTSTASVLILQKCP
jgi:hypothetical protein